MKRIASFALFVAVLLAPVFLPAQSSSHSGTVTWTAGTCAAGQVCDPATSFDILRSTSTGTETLLASVPGTQFSYTDSAVVAGTKYFYQVRAVNAGGTATSVEFSGTVPTNPPAAPASVGVTEK